MKMVFLILKLEEKAPIYELAVDIMRNMKSSSDIEISGLREEGEVLDRKLMQI